MKQSHFIQVNARIVRIGGFIIFEITSWHETNMQITSEWWIIFISADTEGKNQSCHHLLLIMITDNARSPLFTQKGSQRFN